MKIFGVGEEKDRDCCFCSGKASESRPSVRTPSILAMSIMQRSLHRPHHAVFYAALRFLFQFISFVFLLHQLRFYLLRILILMP